MRITKFPTSPNHHTYMGQRLNKSITYLSNNECGPCQTACRLSSIAHLCCVGTHTDTKWGPALLPTPGRRTSIRLGFLSVLLRLLVSAACSAVAAGGIRRCVFGCSPSVWYAPLRIRTPPAACILPRCSLSGFPRHSVAGPAFSTLPACACPPPVPIDTPPGFARFPCGTCANSRPKKLIFLQFPAFRPAAYSHDAVIKRESYQA